MLEMWSTTLSLQASTVNTPPLLLYSVSRTLRELASIIVSSEDGQLLNLVKVTPLA